MTMSRTKEGGQYSENECCKLCAFSTSLYPIITSPSTTPYPKVESFSPRAFFNYSVNQFTPLMAFIFDIATVKADRDLQKSMLIKIINHNTLMLLVHVISCWDVLTDILVRFNSCLVINLRCRQFPRMLAKTGKRWSIDVFMTVIHVVLTLWIMTHATEYWCLTCDLLIVMECASPATKALYANELFTRMTSTGNSEFVDLPMEKLIESL